MKALPWIILAIVLLALAYFYFTNKNRGASTTNAEPSTLNPQPPTTTQPVNPISFIPVTSPGSQLGTASCVNSPVVVNLISMFQNSKPLQVLLRADIKTQIKAICPQAEIYLVR